MSETKMYIVYFSTPNNPGYTAGLTTCASNQMFVLATGFDEAVSKVKIQNPDATVISVNIAGGYIA